MRPARPHRSALWRKSRRVAGWSVFGVFILLWAIFLKRTVTVGSRDFTFLTSDPRLRLERIVRERGENDRLTLDLCLRGDGTQPIGLSFDEVLVTPTGDGWPAQRFAGDGVRRWTSPPGKGDLTGEDCLSLLCRFPRAVKPLDKQVELEVRVKYAAAIPKGDKGQITVEPERSVDAKLVVADEILQDLLSHRFVWETIFGRNRLNPSSE